MQTVHSPEFQELLANVEAALIRAGKHAQKLAEQTGTKLVIVRNDSAVTACPAESLLTSTGHTSVDTNP